MKLPVGGEVRRVHLILAICVSRYERHDVRHFCGIGQDGEFHLHNDVGNIHALFFPRVKNAGRGLPAVDDLKILDAFQTRMAVLATFHVNLGGGATKTVVVCKKTVRLIAQRLLKPFVDFTFGLKKRAHIAFQQSLSVFAIDFCQ